MATIGIVYTDKLARGHEHITHLGSSTERYTRREVVRRLDLGDVFYVAVGTDVALIRVVEDKVHGRYVRTVADGKYTDNLLSLPPCPHWLQLVA